MTLDEHIEVVVVEDEAPKRRHLVKALKAWENSCVVSECASVTEALKLLEHESYDLLVLDMSLPTFTVTDEEGGGRPQGFGGIEILRTLMLQEIFIFTIVITGFEAFVRDSATVDLSELTSELEDEFGSMLLGVIHFDSTLNDWQSELCMYLTNLPGRDSLCGS